MPTVAVIYFSAQGTHQIAEAVAEARRASPGRPWS